MRERVTELEFFDDNTDFPAGILYGKVALAWRMKMTRKVVNVKKLNNLDIRIYESRRTNLREVVKNF